MHDMPKHKIGRTFGITPCDVIEQDLVLICRLLEDTNVDKVL